MRPAEGLKPTLQCSRLTQLTLQSPGIFLAATVPAEVIKLFPGRALRWSLRQIATRAKVSLGLLYRYYPSKDALVLELYDELSREFVTRATPLRTQRGVDPSRRQIAFSSMRRVLV